MCTSDKRLTGLSEEDRKEVARFLYTAAFFVKRRDGKESAAAYEALAELVESAGREGE